MKRISIILAVALIIISNFSFLSFAKSETDVPRLVDNACIIPDEDEEEILKLLDSVSEKRKMDIVIVTTSTTGGASAADYADDYFDYNHFGFGKNRDGILLLISMYPRNVYISTCGKGIKIVPTDDIDSLIDTFYSDLTQGNYSSACKTFAEKTDSKISSFKMRPFILIPIAFILGFIISSIIISNMKNKLKSVSKKVEATNYEVQNSLMLAASSDSLLYVNITKTPRPKQSDSSSGGTHVSSSGTTHGGGGRSF